MDESKLSMYKSYLVQKIKDEIKKIYIEKNIVVNKSNFTILDLNNQQIKSEIKYEINFIKNYKFMSNIDATLMENKLTIKAYELVIKVFDIPVYNTKLHLNDYDSGMHEENEKIILSNLNQIGTSYIKYCSYIYDKLLKEYYASLQYQTETQQTELPIYQSIKAFGGKK
jgi:hypothetical protein